MSFVVFNLKMSSASRTCRLGLDDEASEFATVAHAEFRHQTGSIRIDGFFRRRQAFGDLGTRGSRRDRMQPFELAFTQALVRPLGIEVIIFSSTVRAMILGAREKRAGGDGAHKFGAGARFCE